jgi:hypothetical protein
MNHTTCILEGSTRDDLERVVEPLASYICAADQPRSALRWALSALLREVAATNRAAATHSRAYLAG